MRWQLGGMVSETANNVIGGLGGAVLAACLAPQLIKLAVTKSARDLSYIFLCLYNVSGRGCLFRALTPPVMLEPAPAGRPRTHASISLLLRRTGE